MPVCARIPYSVIIPPSSDYTHSHLLFLEVHVSFILILFPMRQSALAMWCGVAAVMVVMSVEALALGSRPPYIGCQTSDECGKGECCVIGMGRYSIPNCRPRPDVGEQCRPLGEPVNTTLHYPDGVSVDLSGVYYIECPCHVGLACSDDMECVHQEVSNHIDQQYDYSEESNFHY